MAIWTRKLTFTERENSTNNTEEDIMRSAAVKIFRIIRLLKIIKKFIPKYHNNNLF
jgi:hypothetical protein